MGKWAPPVPALASAPSSRRSLACCRLAMAAWSGSAGLGTLPLPNDAAAGLGH